MTKEQVIDWRDSASRHRAIHRTRNPHGLAKNQAEQNRKQRVLAASVKKQKQTAHAKGEQDLTLTSAGKFTDKMASDIYNDLEKRELPNGLLLVEGWRFENKERVMEAIHDLADRLQFALKRQIRKQARKH